MKWIGMFSCLTFLAAFCLMIPAADAAAETYESFIRLDPSGPPGVGMKGDEKKKEHVYYTSPTNELISAGVWEAVTTKSSGPEKPGEPDESIAGRHTSLESLAAHCVSGGTLSW